MLLGEVGAEFTDVMATVSYTEASMAGEREWMDDGQMDG